MNIRIRKVRKNAGLTQEAFGKKIGITRAAICKLESGENKPTEQTLTSICREFNINYQWLKDGMGEMSLQQDESAHRIIEQVMSGENEFAKMLFKGFAQFDVNDWRALESLIRKLLSGISIEEIQAFLSGCHPNRENNESLH